MHLAFNTLACTVVTLDQCTSLCQTPQASGCEGDASYLCGMIKIILPISFIVVSASFALAASSSAPSDGGKAELRKYCTGDALNLCGDLDSDDPAMKACFKKNRSKLSENCRRAIDAYGRSTSR